MTMLDALLSTVETPIDRYPAGSATVRLLTLPGGRGRVVLCERTGQAAVIDPLPGGTSTIDEAVRRLGGRVTQVLWTRRQDGDPRAGWPRASWTAPVSASEARSTVVRVSDVHVALIEDEPPDGPIFAIAARAIWIPLGDTSIEVRPTSTPGTVTYRVAESRCPASRGSPESNGPASRGSPESRHGEPPVSS